MEGPLREIPVGRAGRLGFPPRRGAWRGGLLLVELALLSGVKISISASGLREGVKAFGFFSALG